MTDRQLWRPSRRIVRIAAASCGSVSSINPPTLLRWPSCALNSSADYSIDFGPLLEEGDRIVVVAFETVAGSVAWSSVFGTLATAWISWKVIGTRVVTASVQTANGQILTANVSITITLPQSLIAPVNPVYAPNAAQAWGAFVTDSAGEILLLG